MLKIKNSKNSLKAACREIYFLSFFSKNKIIGAVLEQEKIDFVQSFLELFCFYLYVCELI